MTKIMATLFLFVSVAIAGIPAITAAGGSSAGYSALTTGAKIYRDSRGRVRNREKGYLGNGSTAEAALAVATKACRANISSYNEQQRCGKEMTVVGPSSHYFVLVLCTIAGQLTAPDVGSGASIKAALKNAQTRKRVSVSARYPINGCECLLVFHNGKRVE